MSWFKVSPTPTISMSLWELISSDKRGEMSLHIISQCNPLTGLNRVGHIISYLPGADKYGHAK